MAFSLRNIGGSKFVIGKAQGDEGQICGVWGSAGKIYICTNESKDLFVTDIAPRSRWAEKYYKIIHSAVDKIFAVFQNPRCPCQIYVVYNNSITDCIEHNPSTNQWTKTHSFRLSNAKGAEILSICFHQLTSMFFWCEKRGASEGLASCCMCMREVPEMWDENFMSVIGPVVAMLQCCPMMSLSIINKGVCMVPQLPGEEQQLLFYWTFVPRSLKVYVWDCKTVDCLGKTDFRSMIMHLLPVWNSSAGNDHIICLCTHPTTLELLVLDSKFTLSYASIQDGELCIQKLNKINLPYDMKKQAVRSMFCFGLFTGLIFESGMVNIFDSRSGIGLHTMQELAGQSLFVWTYGGCIPSIGVWTAKGIWEFKSKCISDVAGVMQSSWDLDHQNSVGDKCGDQESLMPEEKVSSKTTIACETCFPGYVKCPTRINPDNRNCTCGKSISGPVGATQFLQAWNMNTAAAKVVLQVVATKISLSDTVDFPEVELEHLKILLSKTFQSPVASIVLFYQHPCFKGQVLSSMKSFLHNWEQKVEADKQSTKTALNTLLYNHIKEFAALTDKYDSIIMQKSVFGDITNHGSSKDEVEHLFNKLNLVNPDNQLLSRLTYLQGQSQRDVFESVAHIMGLELFSEGNASPTQMKINSQRWRKLFRIEWKDGHWQKKRAAFEGSVNPSLGLLCNLLYNEEPDWLLKVHESGLGLLTANDTDERAKDYVTQSMLDCLPSLIVDSRPKSTYVHAILLWTSGQELQAMQVILRHQMWSQALDFFSSFTEHSNFCAALFAMMLKAFVNHRAPKVVVFKALSLVPPGFSAYELLFLLQQYGSQFEQPFEDDTYMLTVGDIRDQLKNMLSHSIHQ